MDRHLRMLLALATALALLALARASQAEGPGTGFTYQGVIRKDGAPYTGACQLTFTLWDAIGAGAPPVGGTQIDSPRTYLNVPVTNGAFRLKIDFGEGAFNGDDRWLQIAVVCPSGGGAETTLAARQQVTPAPYALALPGLVTHQNATSPNVVGGYSGNSVTAGMVGASIGGGGELDYPNQVTGSYGTVAGGEGNTAGYSAVAAGHFNSASGDDATVAGGHGSSADGNYGTVGGGHHNVASGYKSTVPGGQYNTAAGNYSFAAGSNAKANHTGAFVWADSQDFDFASASNDSFRVRASGGGVRFVLGIDGTGATTWSCLANNGNSWSCSSDRNQKENLEEPDAAEVLARVRALPVLRWNAKGQDASVKHVGPMAQDFFAAFHLGDDDRMISSIDLDGVALLALQALDRTLEERTAQQRALAASLEDRLCRLEAENHELRLRLDLRR